MSYVNGLHQVLGMPGCLDIAPDWIDDGRTVNSFFVLNIVCQSGKLTIGTGAIVVEGHGADPELA